MVSLLGIKFSEQSDKYPAVNLTLFNWFGIQPGTVF